MSRRTAIAGLTVSLLALLLTILLFAGTSLPGPELRRMLGLYEPPDPIVCKLEPGDIRDPAGRPAAGRWRVEPASPLPSPEYGAARVGRYVYMVGGQEFDGTVNTLLRFDPATGEYRREPAAPVAIDHPVVAAHDGKLILASGFVDGSDPTNSAWSYSPESGEWEELPPMEIARGGAAGTVIGDRLYVAGGTTAFGSDKQPIGSLEIYDFEQGRWERGPDMPTARHHFGVGVIGEKAYFAGGRRIGEQSLATFEAFDPAANRWRRLPPVPTGTGAAGVTSVNGKVVVTGGGEDPLLTDEPWGWVLRAVYAYDPPARRWTRLPDMNRARHGHAAVAAGGRVYVFRGAPCPGYGLMSSVESLQMR